jgi:hypothetical protein
MRQGRDWVCDFCDKGQRGVGLIIAGPRDVAICDECTDAAARIVAQKRVEDRGQDGVSCVGSGVFRSRLRPAAYFVASKIHARAS